MKRFFIPLALTLFLVGGCSLAPTLSPLSSLDTLGQSLPLSAAQKSFAIQSVQDLSSQLQVEQDQTVGELLSDSSYSVLAGRFEPMQTRMQNVREKMKPRLEKKGQGMTVTKSTVTNPDGTIDESVLMERSGKNAIRREVIRRYQGDDLIRITTVYQATHPSGVTVESTRVKDLNEDGSYTVTFDSKLTRPNGKTKLVHWVRSGNADGTEVKVEGTITRFDGQVVNLSIVETDGKIKATIEDPVKVEVSQEEGSATIEATVTDPQSGQSDSRTLELPSEDVGLDPSQG
ncbi:MAG: hypothetical protein ACM3YO_02315 [Bacteroidota bacterium]